MKRLLVFTLLLTFAMACGGGSNSGVSKFLENEEFKKAYDLLLTLPVDECEVEDLLRTGQYFSEKTAFQFSIPMFEKLLLKDPSNVPGRLFLANNLRQTKEDDNSL